MKTYKCLVCGKVFKVEDGAEAVCPVCGVSGEKLELILEASAEKVEEKKANMPSRIAFSVSSGVDSRTILDSNGAEKLLGKGDMLYFPQGMNKPSRVQGCFVSDDEVGKVVKFIKDQHIINENDDITAQLSASGNELCEVPGGEADELFAQAGSFIIDKEKASIGALQRAFKIGFNRAARIMDQLEAKGVVGPEEGTKPRKILMSVSEFEELIKSMK